MNLKELNFIKNILHHHQFRHSNEFRQACTLLLQAAQKTLTIFQKKNAPNESECLMEYVDNIYQLLASTITGNTCSSQCSATADEHDSTASNTLTKEKLLQAMAQFPFFIGDYFAEIYSLLEASEYKEISVPDICQAQRFFSNETAETKKINSPTELLSDWVVVPPPVDTFNKK